MLYQYQAFHAVQDRRKRRDAPKKMIAASLDHIANTASDIADLKQLLPDGVLDLVDQRNAYGLLKYPDRQFHSLVAKLEYCYCRLQNGNT